LTLIDFSDGFETGRYTGYLTGQYTSQQVINNLIINPLKAELNPICHLLELLGAHLIFHVSRIRVNTELPEAYWHLAILFS
jgi:hypothetical protein